MAQNSKWTTKTITPEQKTAVMKKAVERLTKASVSQETVPAQIFLKESLTSAEKDAMVPDMETFT